MNRFQCRTCKTLFTTEKEIGRCGRCGAINTKKIDANEVLSVIGKKETKAISVQNFRCLDCGNEFQLRIGDKTSCIACPRCRKTRLKPLSPLAYLAESTRKDKKKAKFTKFIEQWEKDVLGMKQYFCAIENILISLGMRENITDLNTLKEILLKHAVNKKEKKLGKING